MTPELIEEIETIRSALAQSARLYNSSMAKAGLESLMLINTALHEMQELKEEIEALHAELGRIAHG